MTIIVNQDEFIEELDSLLALANKGDTVIIQREDGNYFSLNKLDVQDEAIKKFLLHGNSVVPVS